MARFFEGLRGVLRWRAARGRTHWFGIAEHTTHGTIVACKDEQWRIEDDHGRFVVVPVRQFSPVSNLQLGDRVEVQPLQQGGPLFRPYGWTIVRRMELSGEGGDATRRESRR